MADVVDVGLLPNDGNGDKLRTGGQKINTKFAEVDAAVALNTAKVTNATHTGDVTGSGALTLATVNLAPGTYYNATITVDAKGRATVVATGNHTGDVTGSQALTLSSTGVVAGTYTNASFTVDAKGRLSAAASGVFTTSSTLAANATTNVTIGNRTTDLGVIVKYALTRGTIFQMGEIKVLSRSTSVDVPSWIVDLGDDAGITSITANLSGDNIRIAVAVDNSSATSITFRYNLDIITLT